MQRFAFPATILRASEVARQSVARSHSEEQLQFGATLGTRIRALLCRRSRRAWLEAQSADASMNTSQGAPPTGRKSDSTGAVLRLERALAAIHINASPAAIEELDAAVCGAKGLEVAPVRELLRQAKVHLAEQRARGAACWWSGVLAEQRAR